MDSLPLADRVQTDILQCISAFGKLGTDFEDNFLERRGGGLGAQGPTHQSGSRVLESRNHFQKYFTAASSSALYCSCRKCHAQLPCRPSPTSASDHDGQ